MGAILLSLRIFVYVMCVLMEQHMYIIISCPYICRTYLDIRTYIYVDI